MTQDVLVTITGLHATEQPGVTASDEDTIEIITPANYYFKNGKHYILYDEVVEGFPGVTKNTIKIVGEDFLEVKKSGITNSDMVFERDRINVSQYDTPYGKMQVGVHTRHMDIDVQEDLITIEVIYELDVDREALASCKISMKIQSRGTGSSIL